MLAKRVVALLLAALMLCFVPPAVADDDIQSASPLTDGVTSSGYVCDPDCDAGNDRADFWKIEAKKGDIVQISFSGTMNGPAWWCIGDGWQGRVSLLNAQGGTIVDSYVDDNAASKTLSTTVASQSFVYFKIKADDSWCNDGFDYTITPSIDKSNRDTDEDGFVDIDDDCDDVVGSSTNDRNGCIDTDGDGWSDPETGWLAQNGADAFYLEPTQWLDSDNDNYGDNLDGFEGDHCPFRRGYSTMDRFGCLDSDGDGYSDDDPGGLDGVTAWFAHPIGLGDAFPIDETQWNDTDADGYGDNWAEESWNTTRLGWGIGSYFFNASTPDACPFITGTSSGDRYGCTDSDGDSYSDGDLNWTVTNGSDAFPFEESQWRDRDYDGWGDNQSNVDGEFHWRGGLGDQFKHTSFRGPQGRRSHQMHRHPARDLERTAVPFSLKVGHWACAEQFAERSPIQEIFRHLLAGGVQRNGRRFNPCHGVCCCSLQATGSADQPSRRVCCPSVM